MFLNPLLPGLAAGHAHPRHHQRGAPLQSVKLGAKRPVAGSNSDVAGCWRMKPTNGSWLAPLWQRRRAGTQTAGRVGAGGLLICCLAQQALVRLPQDEQHVASRTGSTGI